MAEDLEGGRTTSRKLVEDCLARIADPAGEGQRAFIHVDKAAALAQFAKGEGGFKDRDLYPFCAGADGMFTAHPTLTGKSLKDLKDKTGKPLGEEILAAGAEGKINEVSYMWPRPGQT